MVWTIFTNRKLESTWKVTFKESSINRHNIDFFIEVNLVATDPNLTSIVYHPLENWYEEDVCWWWILICDATQSFSKSKIYFDWEQIEPLLWRNFTIVCCDSRCNRSWREHLNLCYCSECNQACVYNNWRTHHFNSFHSFWETSFKQFGFKEWHDDKSCLDLIYWNSRFWRSRRNSLSDSFNRSS